MFKELINAIMSREAVPLKCDLASRARNFHKFAILFVVLLITVPLKNIYALFKRTLNGDDLAFMSEVDDQVLIAKCGGNFLAPF